MIGKAKPCHHLHLYHFDVNPLSHIDVGLALPFFALTYFSHLPSNIGHSLSHTQRINPFFCIRIVSVWCIVSQYSIRELKLNPILSYGSAFLSLAIWSVGKIFPCSTKALHFTNSENKLFLLPLSNVWRFFSLAKSKLH